MIRLPDTASAAWSALKSRADHAWEQVMGREGCSTVLVGNATCGRSAGARAVMEAAEDEAAAMGLKVHVVPVGCLGHCYAEPMAILHSPDFPPILYGRLTPDKMRVLLRKIHRENDPVLEWCMGATVDNDMIPALNEIKRFEKEEKRLLARCGLFNPGDILQAVHMGCYEGFLNSLRMEPMEIIEDLKRAGLRGLGGAGFPAWKKWKICAEAEGEEKYVVCNADEGDPGAFMDRTILESDPHSVIEGMLIAARATGARRGFIYVRREYPLAVEFFSKALDAARTEGLLGTGILGTDMELSMDVREGAGAFVCGESTALIMSLEGKRGMPRVKPPRSALHGYRGRPTLLNNVKTFAYAGHIMNRGPEWFSSIGTERSKGTALFALAGKVRKTGLVEVPMGTSLRDIVETFGGGVALFKKTSDVEGKPSPARRRKFKAVQIGGPSGGWMPESLLDAPVDFDSLQSAGAMMGSGGMVVLDEDNCIVNATKFFLKFTQRESCGKCTFCRIGTFHMLRILERITAGKGTPEDLELLEELAQDIKAGSLCNLGKTAPNPVLSSIRYFRDEYEAHIHEKRCPARECQDLITYVIVLEKCQRSCEACLGSCPTEAIVTLKNGLKQIDVSKCVKCGACLAACPSHYDAVEKRSPVPPAVDTPASRL